ncbi:MAG: MFS transporter [Vicinamibacteria bacterium]
MRREGVKAAGSGLAFTGILAALILLGSRNLSHFDAALVAYTFAILFATFGIVYRYAMWLQRPPTALYWKRGWQTFFHRGHVFRNLAGWPRRILEDILLTRFIWTRGRLRGLAHFLIMWGSLLAVLITFPLVFGWLYFESAPSDLESYRAVVFGFPTLSFPVESAAGFFLFHGLVWSSFLVLGGVMLAMRRRMREGGAAAVQMFDLDFLPLVLLFAVSLTGLMLTASYTWMKGYGYDFIALIHAVTVIATILWLPFGKFFHIFQRPAQLGVRFYKNAGRSGEAARCRRCGHPFSSRMHVEDLILVERELGYRYEIPGDPAQHYQWICPPCRRGLLALAQGALWRVGGAVAEPRPDLRPTPAYVNPGRGEGPLGEEDEINFHL